jgi:hypothetical protein
VLPGLLSGYLVLLNGYFGHGPVCRVECNGVHLDENAVLKEFGTRDVLNLGLAGGHDLDGLHV